MGSWRYCGQAAIAEQTRTPTSPPHRGPRDGRVRRRRYRKLRLPESKIRSQARQAALYAYPQEKSIGRFMDQVRQRTKRTRPLTTQELIAGLNPLLRGWGEYCKRAHVRKLFQRLDGWIRRRIWSHRYKRWRNVGWKRLPARQLYDEYELVRLLELIPSLASRRC